MLRVCRFPAHVLTVLLCIGSAGHASVLVSHHSFDQSAKKRMMVQIRAAALTATQCASYDEAKQWWMRTTGMGNSFGTHFGASMVTGLATTTVTAPVDLIKTRMFIGGAQPFPSRLHGSLPL